MKENVYLNSNHVVHQKSQNLELLFLEVFISSSLLVLILRDGIYIYRHCEMHKIFDIFFSMICGQFFLRNMSLLAFSVNAFVLLSLWCEESEELRMAAQLDGFPKFKCFILPGVSYLSSGGWSLSIPLHPSSISSCHLSHVCMVSLIWSFLIPFFPIVFLYCQNTPPSLPYYKPAGHPALLGRIINQS